MPQNVFSQHLSCNDEQKDQYSKKPTITDRFLLFFPQNLIPVDL